MFVLGIDPGMSRCGYGLVQRPEARQPIATLNGGAQAVRAGVLMTPREDPLPTRLMTLSTDLEELFDECNPDVVVVERVFFQTNVRTAMSVGQASGLALAIAARRRCEVVQYTANEVKHAVTGDGSASKEQVQRMVQSLLALAEIPKPPDVADALALALCHLGQASWLEKVKAGT